MTFIPAVMEALVLKKEMPLCKLGIYDAKVSIF